MVKLLRLCSTLGILLLLLPACSFKIQALPPSGVICYEDRLPYDAGILIPPQEAARSISQGGLCCIGVVHTWDILIGEALRDYSQRYFDEIFRNVSICNSSSCLKENPEMKALIIPTIRNLSIAQGLDTTLTLHIIIEDKTCKTIYENDFSGATRGSQALGKACIGGVMMGECALRESVSSALDDAFTKAIFDLRKTNNWEMLKAL
jgi:hypothetical protein